MLLLLPATTATCERLYPFEGPPRDLGSGDAPAEGSFCATPTTYCPTLGCRDLTSDVTSCGTCGKVCTGPLPQCQRWTCTSSNCAPGPDLASVGLPCDDSNLCTGPDLCTTAGTCVGAAKQNACSVCQDCNPATGTCVNDDTVPCGAGKGKCCQGTCCAEGQVCCPGQTNLCVSGKCP